MQNKRIPPDTKKEQDTSIHLERDQIPSNRSGYNLTCKQNRIPHTIKTTGYNHNENKKDTKRL